MRTRRCDPSSPGYTRRRRGRGFSYIDQHGHPLASEDAERIAGLVIPPAWTDVWICPDPQGHIQATGTDAAGRRQYRYHDAWREHRDRAKFAHVRGVARAMPTLRKRVRADLGTAGYGHDRVLATAVRLLDLGAFRVGGEAYADGDDATYGLATLLRAHVTAGKEQVAFRFPAKGNIERRLSLTDADIVPVIRGLLRRRDDNPELLAFKDSKGWHDVHSGDVNAYLKEASGIDMSAKDFRTWQATVLAAAAFAGAVAAEGPARTKTAGNRVVARVCREVSDYLGNTPSVARASYVDPQVIDRYRTGNVIDAPSNLTTTRDRHRVERAVLKLLD